MQNQMLYEENEIVEEEGVAGTEKTDLHRTHTDNGI